MLFIGIISAQSKDPNQILDNLKKSFDSIEDYSATVSVHLDVDFLQMPDSKATVYFKKPDKFKLDSKGFAMLPKQTVGFSPVKFLEHDYDAVYIKEDTLANSKVDVIKIIPRSDSGEVILTTAWIDVNNGTLKRIESNTRTTGTFKIDFTYGEALKYKLPSKINFYFSLADAGMRMRVPKDIDDKKEMFSKKSIEGEVVLTYSNYKINKGIPDDFFNDDEQENKKLQ